jgi:hypothetical protein
MIVAMVPMRMMKVAVHQVIDMVAMRDLRMTAIGAVNVRLVMPSTVVGRGASVRVRGRDLQHVLLDSNSRRMLQMTFVEIVDMPLMADRGMSAAFAMLMWMPLVWLGSCHREYLLFQIGGGAELVSA